MLIVVAATLLSFVLAMAAAPLARHSGRQLWRLPSTSRITVAAGAAAVWLAVLAGALVVAADVGREWIPCAFAASCSAGMLALIIFTSSAKEEQERLKAALAEIGASGPLHRQSASVRLHVWASTWKHNGAVARAVRWLLPVVAVAVVAIWWFVEGVSW